MEIKNLARFKKYKTSSPDILFVQKYFSKSMLQNVVGYEKLYLGLQDLNGRFFLLLPIEIPVWYFRLLGADLYKGCLISHVSVAYLLVDTVSVIYFSSITSFQLSVTIAVFESWTNVLFFSTFDVAVCLQSAVSVKETLCLPNIECLFQVPWETDLGSTIMH